MQKLLSNMKRAHGVHLFRRILTAVLSVAVLIAGIGILPADYSALSAAPQPEPAREWKYLGPEGNVYARVCKLGPYPADGFKMQALRYTRTPKYLWVEFTGQNSRGEYITVRLPDYSLRRPANRWGPTKIYRMYSLDNTVIINFMVMHKNPTYSHGTLGFKFKNTPYCP